MLSYYFYVCIFDNHSSAQRTPIFILKLNCHLGLEILLQSQFVDMWLKWNIASTLILHSSP